MTTRGLFYHVQLRLKVGSQDETIAIFCVGDGFQEERINPNPIVNVHYCHGFGMRMVLLIIALPLIA